MTVPAYYDRINHQLLESIPKNLGRIVEVGCGTGALGAAYKKNNPNSEYIGLELNPEAVTIAQERLDRALCFNVEDSDESQLGIAPQSCDALIYGDVLEHLQDPWTILNHHVSWLKPGGYLLASIPNIQHWTILRDLIQGKWDYQDEGLLDRTHLRFFTLDSMQKLLTGAGLIIQGVSRILAHNPKEFEDFYPKLEPLAQHLKVDPNRFKLLTETHQYILTGVKTQRRLFIQTLMMAPLACDRIRILEPDQFSNRITGVRAVSSVQSATLSLAEADEEKVFIWQRALLKPKTALAQQKNLLQRGYLIVSEIDDDPLRWETPSDNGLFSYRSCHCVQTSTEPLAEFLRQYNPYVKVFPNQLAKLPKPRPQSDYETATVFFGALNREDDWKPLIQTINEILDELGDRVSVKVLHDRQFFEALNTPHKAFSPFCAYDSYQQVIRSSTVALLPLEPTRFNTMKSDLKFVECAGQGVAVLASPTVYERSLQDGKTGLLYRSVDDFGAKFRELLVSPSLRQQLGQAAYQWVAQHRLLEHHAQARAKWYFQMRDRLPELNDALKQRAPELFETP
ncbi:methyltransferase [Sodalinema gerasimenkoae]|uniref:methyltransferase n=1 Tax=Sodalinema gerasimenkoae TaxID=2862348 RepID=UPI001359CA88|nr:methyltransferase [Sodalinema gerasimenkoae]